MTACVNNQNKEGAAKRAVSATLAGVLAVGMVPAVALAAPAEEAAGDDGIQELLAGDQAAAFSNGYISAISLNGRTLTLNKDGDITTTGPDKGKTPYVVASGNPVAVTGVAVTVDGVAAPVNSDITVSFQNANGNPVAAIIDPGKYYVVATGNSGTDYAGASVKVAIEVQPAVLTNAYPYIVNPDDAADTSKNSNFAFSGSALNFGFAIPSGASPAAADPTLKAGKDYTVQFYNRDTNTAVSSVVNKGTYYAVLTGLGMYNGAKWTTGSFVVNPFDLSGSTVEAPDFTGAYPTQPTSIVKAGNELNPNQVILVPSQGEQDLDTPGQKNFDVVPTTAAADSGNVINSATTTAYKVGTMASFQYHGSALPSTVTVDLSKKETFALNDIVATYTNAAGKVVTLEQGFAGTYKTDSPVVLEVKGTNGTANPSAPTASGWADLGAGTYEVTATVNAAACGSKAGGSQTIAVKVIDSSIDADANGYITYDGKAFTSLEKVYNGSTGYAVDNFAPILTNADGSAITARDYALDIKDAQGNKVTASELTEAGTYTLTIVSSKYNVTGNATATFTITPLDLTKPAIYKDATAPGTPDMDSDSKVIPLVTNNGAGYEYIDTTKGANPTFADYAPFVNTGTADEPVYVEVGGATTTPGVSLVWQILNEKNEWVPAAATPVEGKIESYRLVILCNEQNAGNYKLASGNETILSYVGIPKDEFKFIDVLPGDWYFVTAYDVTSVVTGTYKDGLDDKGQPIMKDIYLMNGTSNTTFAPNAVMTRAMAAGVMCNMSGSDPLSLTANSTFSDVPTDAWFAKAVSWAQETGTVNGKSASIFDPDGNVTREQFMGMLSNYAKHTGMYKAVDTDAVLGQKADGSSVSDWARECVAWGVANKIIGKGDAAINPQGSMTRAEAASMAMAYWTGIAGQPIA